MSSVSSPPFYIIPYYYFGAVGSCTAKGGTRIKLTTTISSSYDTGEVYLRKYIWFIESSSSQLCIIFSPNLSIPGVSIVHSAVIAILRNLRARVWNRNPKPLTVAGAALVYRTLVQTLDLTGEFIQFGLE